jgi:hypothetical protein
MTPPGRPHRYTPKNAVSELPPSQSGPDFHVFFGSRGTHVRVIPLTPRAKREYPETQEIPREEALAFVQRMEARLWSVRQVW